LILSLLTTKKKIALSVADRLECTGTGMGDNEGREIGEKLMARKG